MILCLFAAIIVMLTLDMRQLLQTVLMLVIWVEDHVRVYTRSLVS